MKQTTKTVLTVVITVIAFMTLTCLIGSKQEEEGNYLEDYYENYMEGCIQGSIELVDYDTAYNYCDCTYDELMKYDNDEVFNFMRESLEDELSPETTKVIVDIATKCRGEIK